MKSKDQLLLEQAYLQIQEEGLGKTLGSLALAVMGILGAAKGVEHGANEYSQGLPSLKAPDENTAKRELDSYLNKVGMIKVKADDKHMKALTYIAQNSPDHDIRTRAQFILDKQSRIGHQH